MLILKDYLLFIYYFNVLELFVLSLLQVFEFLFA